MCSSIPCSLVGQDIRLSPERPGFESRRGNQDGRGFHEPCSSCCIEPGNTCTRLLCLFLVFSKKDARDHEVQCQIKCHRALQSTRQAGMHMHLHISHLMHAHAQHVNDLALPWARVAGGQPSLRHWQGRLVADHGHADRAPRAPVARRCRAQRRGRSTRCR